MYFIPLHQQQSLLAVKKDICPLRGVFFIFACSRTEQKLMGKCLQNACITANIKLGSAQTEEKKRKNTCGGDAFEVFQ